MTFRIVTDAQPAGSARRHDAVIAIVGCGGTGSFLADAVCRLLIGREAELFLIDHDRVEPHNALRQNFSSDEVGAFKAEALARRLSRRYHRNVGYSVLPYDHRAHGGLWASLPAALPLLIGCVDNAEARRAISESLFDARDEGDPPRAYASRPRPAPFWLDLGNGEHDGQAFLGNAGRIRWLDDSFKLGAGTVDVLPAPSLQAPELLSAPPATGTAPAPDCAEAALAGDQSPVVNQAMAALGAVFVHRLLEGTCPWMGAQISLRDGAMHAVPADPKVVAKITGVGANRLVDRHDAQARYQEEGEAPRDAGLAEVVGREAVRLARREVAGRRAQREALVQAIAMAPADERPGGDFLAALEAAQREAAG